MRNVNLEDVTCGRSRYGVMIIAIDTCTNVSDINIIDCNFNKVAEGNYIKGRTADINFKNLTINGQVCTKPE